jgi:uncharacterized protein involved in outer membrane biogenesis
VKKLLISIALIVLILAAAALIGPRFVDASRYKGEIAARIQDATGRTLAIDGPVSFEFLPRPRLDLADVRLANLEGAALPDMVRLKSLDLKLALFPLLGGQVVIESLELNAPTINLERLKDGRVNWRLTPETARSSGNSVNLTGVALGGSLGRLQFDRVEMRDGTLVYRDDGSGARYELDKLAGQISTQADAPIEFRGSALHRDLPIAFDATLERALWLGASDGRAAGIDVKVAAAGATLSLDGGLTRAPSGYDFAGKLKLAGADLKASALSLGLDDAALLPAFFAQSFEVDGDAKASNGAFELASANVDLGDSEASGSFTYAPANDPTGTPRIDGKLAFERLDIDRAPKPAAPASSSSAAPAPGPAVASPAAGLTLPKTIELHFDVRASALLYRGAAIRSAQLTLALERGQLLVEKATAELPGDSDATVYGAVRASDAGAAAFTGNLVLGSDNLRDLMAWLGIDAGAVPAERLRKLALNAALDASPGRIELRDLDGTVDTSHVRGGGTILFGARPAYGVSLALDRLNLDAYLPSDVAAPGAAAPTSVGGSAPSTAASFNPLVDADGNLHARVDELIYRGQDIRGLEFDGTLQSGALTLRDARVADLAGLAADMKGSLVGLPLAPKLDLAFEAHAADLTGFLRFLDLKSPLAPSALGDAILKGHVAGGLAGLDVDLLGTLARIDYTLHGKVGLDGGVGGGRGIGYELAVGAKGPGWGGFDLHANAKGNPTTLALADIAGKVDQVGIDGTMAIGFAGPRPKITAHLEADALDLDRILGSGSRATPTPKPGVGAAAPAPAPAQPWSTEPIHFLPLEAADAEVALAAHEIDYAQFKITQAKLAASLAGGVLDLKSFTGTLYGGTLTLAGKIDDAAGPGGNLDMNLAGADLSAAGLKLGGLRLANGAFQAKAALAAKGLTPAAIVRALSGSASFELANGTIDGFELAAVGQRLDHPAGLVSVLGPVQAAMAGGTTKVKRLSGSLGIGGGVARNDDLVLDAEGGSVKGRGILDLARWNLDYEAAFQIEGAPGAPPFTVSLHGAPDGPRKFINANALQEYMVKRIDAERKPQAPAPTPAPAPNQSSGDAKP